MNASARPVRLTLTPAQLAQVTGGHLPSTVLDVVVKVVVANPK